VRYGGSQMFEVRDWRLEEVEQESRRESSCGRWLLGEILLVDPLRSFWHPRPSRTALRASRMPSG
jgi:hypothetical protein